MRLNVKVLLLLCLLLVVVSANASARGPSGTVHLNTEDDGVNTSEFPYKLVTANERTFHMNFDLCRVALTLLEDHMPASGPLSDVDISGYLFSTLCASTLDVIYLTICYVKIGEEVAMVSVCDGNQVTTTQNKFSRTVDLSNECPGALAFIRGFLPDGGSVLTVSDISVIDPLEEHEWYLFAAEFTGVIQRYLNVKVIKGVMKSKFEPSAPDISKIVFF